MKLAVFGATGTVGSALVDKALAAGHELSVLARTPSKIPRTAEGLRVVTGDARDPDAVRRTIAGSDAVVSMLGGFADTDSIRVGTALISSAMGEARIRRLVVVQGYHLDFPGDPHNVGRKLILPMLYLGSRTLISDSRAMATAIQSSDLDWTLIRAPRITRGRSTGKVRIGALPLGPWDSVVNADVADLVLRCLGDADTVRTAPMIAGGASGAAGLGWLWTMRDILRRPRPRDAAATGQPE
jgi:putative NADH-flavin reductase